MPLTSQNSILIVDDEKDIVELVRYNLQREGYHVLTADNGKDALSLSERRPSLILLDVMMPAMNGLEVLRQLKSRPATAGIPVVFLTAKGSEVDEVIGLELGADDYIVKPISIPKLIARVKAVLRKSESRRPSEQPGKEYRAGVLHIQPALHLVHIEGKETFFPKKEFEILTYLAAHEGEVITREGLLNAVWGRDVYVVDRTVDVHIRKIREKLGRYADYIETIKGIGYRFRIPAE